MLIIIFLTISSTILYLLGILSLLWHLRPCKEFVKNFDLEPISLLKPIKGVEPYLEENICTYFEQDYPAPYEIIFSSTDANDIGMLIARKVAQRYPHIKSQFVISEQNFGLNPKVSNLSGAIRKSAYDLLLQTDANTKAHKDFLRRMATEYYMSGSSLLSCLIIGAKEQSIGSSFDNLHITTHISSSVCFAYLFANTSCVIGKSMMLRKIELFEVDGLVKIKDVLCEDYVIGNIYQTAGKKVVIAKTAFIESVNSKFSILDFCNRHSRWLKMRAVIHKPAFFMEFLANPIVFSLLLFFFSEKNKYYFNFAILIILFKIFGDFLLLKKMRGSSMPLFYHILSPFKDILIWFILWYSIFSRSIIWRGAFFKIGPGSILMKP